MIIPVSRLLNHSVPNCIRKTSKLSKKILNLGVYREKTFSSMQGLHGVFQILPMMRSDVCLKIEVQCCLLNSCIPVCAETIEAHHVRALYLVHVRLLCQCTVRLTLASWLGKYVLMQGLRFHSFEQFLRRNQNATRRSCYMVCEPEKLYFYSFWI